MQLEDLNTTVGECDEIHTKCNKVYQKCKSDLDKWTTEIIVFIKSLENNVQKMEESEPEFVKAIFALYTDQQEGQQLVQQVWYFGTAVLPGIGTVVGAGIGAAVGTVVGGMSGIVVGAVRGEAEHMKMEREV